MYWTQHLAARCFGLNLYLKNEIRSRIADYIKRINKEINELILLVLVVLFY